MAHTSRKKIAAAIIALSTVFTGVAMLPALADKYGDKSDIKSTTVTPPPVAAPQGTTPAPGKSAVNAPRPLTPALSPTKDMTDANADAAALETIRSLQRDVTSKDAAIRAATAQKLGTLAAANPRVIKNIFPVLGQLLRDGDDKVKAAAINGFASIAVLQGVHGSAAINLLGMFSANAANTTALRVAAIDVIAAAATAQRANASLAVNKMVNVAADANRDVRYAAIRGLGQLGMQYNVEHGYEAANTIGTRLKDTDDAVRAEATSWARKICGANPALNCPAIP